MALTKKSFDAALEQEFDLTQTFYPLVQQLRCLADQVVDYYSKFRHPYKFLDDKKLREEFVTACVDRATQCYDRWLIGKNDAPGLPPTTTSPRSWLA